MALQFLFSDQKVGEEKRLCPIKGVSYVADPSSVLLTSSFAKERCHMDTSVRVASMFETPGSPWQLVLYVLSTSVAVRYLKWWL